MLLQASNVCDKSAQVFGRKVYGGHSSAGHFLGRMREEVLHLFDREFGAYASQRGGGGGSYTSVTVARVTCLRLEDRLPFCSQWITERDVGSRQGCRRQFRFERLRHVRLLFGILLRELLSHAAVGSIRIVAAHRETD